MLYLITNEEPSDGHVVSFKPSCSHRHDSTSTLQGINKFIYLFCFFVSNLISQETGTLSIGRYSGELKKGQIFSGGNLVKRGQMRMRVDESSNSRCRLAKNPHALSFALIDLEHAQLFMRVDESFLSFGPS